jgi:hypothetical protein
VIRVEFKTDSDAQAFRLAFATGTPENTVAAA